MSRYFYCGLSILLLLIGEQLFADQEITCALLTGKDKVYQDKFEHKSEQMRGLLVAYQNKSILAKAYHSSFNDQDWDISCAYKKNYSLGDLFSGYLKAGGFIHQLKAKNVERKKLRFTRDSRFWGPEAGLNLSLAISEGFTVSVDTIFRVLWSRQAEKGMSISRLEYAKSSGFIYEVKLSKVIDRRYELFTSYLFDASRTKFFLGSRSAYFFAGLNHSF